jgi:hypothetical protein
MPFVRCAPRLRPLTESYDHGHSVSGSKIGRRDTNTLVLRADNKERAEEREQSREQSFVRAEELARSEHIDLGR